MARVQARTATEDSPLLSAWVWVTLGCLVPLGCTISAVCGPFPPSTTSCPLWSLFRLWSASWIGAGGGSLAWEGFSGALPPVEDSITSNRPVLCFLCIPMSVGMAASSWVWFVCTGKGLSRSPIGASGDRGWLKASKSSSKSDTSTILSYSSSFSSFSSLMTGREDEAPTFGMPSSMGVVTWTPSGMGPVVRKPGVATLIRCRQGPLPWWHIWALGRLWR